jgi:hypothetical protein
MKLLTILAMLAGLILAQILWQAGHPLIAGIALLGAACKLPSLFQDEKGKQ